MIHLPKMHNEKNAHFCNFLGNGKIYFYFNKFYLIIWILLKKKGGEAEMVISEKNRQIRRCHALIIFGRKAGIHTFPPFIFLSSCLLSLFQLFFILLECRESTFRGNELKKSIKLINSTSTQSCLWMKPPSQNGTRILYIFLGIKWWEINFACFFLWFSFYCVR